MVAFLGMGLLGSNFVRAMIQKGAQVQVWNRTYARAEALEQYGAKAFASAAEAVKGARVIHLTTKDDDSVDEVLEQASAGFEPGAIIVDHTTTSVEGAIRRTKEWKERGFVYLHAPVFMGPSNALDSTGFVLVSGDQEVIARLGPDLDKMTGKVLHFGSEPGRASAMKLLGNLYLVVFTSGIADMLSLAGALNVPVSDITALLGEWNPGAAPLPRLQKLAGGHYENPSWELDMSRKDTRLFINGAATAGVQLAVIPAIAAEMDKWIAQGYGKNDWTVIGKAAAEHLKVIQHKKVGTAGLFYMDVEGKTLAKMTYTMPSEHQLVIEHTEVDPALAGKNIGLKLVRTAVDYAREHDLKIIPKCPFAKSVFDLKPEFKDVLA